MPRVGGGDQSGVTGPQTASFPNELSMAVPVEDTEPVIRKVAMEGADADAAAAMRAVWASAVKFPAAVGEERTLWRGAIEHADGSIRAPEVSKSPAGSKSPGGSKSRPPRQRRRGRGTSPQDAERRGKERTPAPQSYLSGVGEAGVGGAAGEAAGGGAAGEAAAGGAARGGAGGGVGAATTDARHARIRTHRRHHRLADFAGRVQLREASEVDPSASESVYGGSLAATCGSSHAGATAARRHAAELLSLRSPPPTFGVGFSLVPPPPTFSPDPSQRRHGLENAVRGLDRRQQKGGRTSGRVQQVL